MRLPAPITRTLYRRAARIMREREPDRVIGTQYLRRWHLVARNNRLNVYLHEFTGSDDDRALHDHPYRSMSIILRGRYWEHLPAYPATPGDGHTHVYIRTTGDITTRAADAAHRIAIPPRHATPANPVITLFITGPRHREWGFWCPKGWRHWRKFTDPTDSGKIGRGCGD